MAASLVVLRRLARTTLSSAPSLVRGSLKRALASKAGGGELVQKQQPKDLVSVLQRELAFEREDGEAVKTLEELRQTLAGEWTILDTPGTSRVALTKKVRRGGRGRGGGGDAVPFRAAAEAQGEPTRADARQR